MKLIKPSYEILLQAPGLEGIYKQIELAGRTCYKSHDKITETSAEEFVNRMIKSGHGAMLEHGTVYLKFETVKTARHPLDKYYYNKYSRVKTEEGLTKLTKIVFVTTNLRVLVENNWLDDLKYLCEPTEYHEKRITVKFICSRSTSHQLVRHRTMSFAQESQRYCNYSSSKFDNQVTFVYPSWLEEFDEQQALDKSPCPDFTYGLLYAEQKYFELLELGLRPQQARQILPNACKTELVVTGFNNDWYKLFDLRCGTGADPDIKELIIPLRDEFFKKLN